MTLRRALLAALALVLALAAVLVANTLRQGSRQVAVAPLAPWPVDADAVARSLAAALQARTVTGLLDPAASAGAFDALHAHLRQRYPRVHASLTREVVGSHGLLYTWIGSDAALPAVALMAHQDVVPVAPGTEALWQRPPFSGAVDGGFVWGRGALDDKVNLVAQLEAVESLLAAGYRPRRTLLLVFGHDEEVGGRQGAMAVVERLRARGARIDFVLDEGLAITEGILPGVARPLALIGLAEKGSVSVRLTAQAPPGHSSMPPAPGSGAIGRLSAALARLDARPMPGGIRGAAAEMFATLAPELPFGQRLAISNRWLLGPLVERLLGASPSSNAMLRTTTALTIFNAGNKENVLPGSAVAVANFRILPGDTSQGVLAHVRAAVADDAVTVELLGQPSEPSTVSSTDSEGWRIIERTVREIFPDALVAPGLVLAATDSRHFQGLAAQTFRFMPIRFKPADLQRVHGTDERIAVAQLADMVRFYRRLVEQALT